MPGFHIHVAIGDKYKTKRKVLNKLDFDKGIIYPDLVEDEIISHYSAHQDKSNLLQYLENKVNLFLFVKDNDIDTDYNRGLFLHLITDYLFFNYFISKDYLKSINYDTFCKDLYYSYNLTNDYIFQKYNITFSVYKEEIIQKIKNARSEKKMDDKEYLNILPKEKLDYFIELVANIDLDKYANKIKKSGKNVLPDELEIIDLLKILWNYMYLGEEIKKSHCILGLGCNDFSVPKRCVELFKQGYADIIIFTGGKGKSTNEWTKTEAELFYEKATSLGVPRDKIFLETKASNTGENFKFTEQLVHDNNLNVNSYIIVQKPYMERRCYAAFKKIIPNKKCYVTSSNASFEQYYLEYLEANGEVMEFFNILVGDVLRMKYYADKGWQIKQEIPIDVWEACLRLVDYGFDKYAITE